MADAVQTSFAAAATVTGKKTAMNQPGQLQMGLFTLPNPGPVTSAIADLGLVPAAGATIQELTTGQLAGYARQNVNWGSVTTGPAGQAQMDAGVVTFSFAGTGSGATIMGWFIIDAGGNLWYVNTKAAVTPPLGAVPSTYSVGTIASPVSVSDVAV